MVTVMDENEGPRLKRRTGGRQRATGERGHIAAATEAALWVLSVGRCYAPQCPAPIIVEVRPGVYQKNATIAHIYGVAPNAPRYRGGLPAEQRDAFSNLLLLCLAHHNEVDDRKTGEQLYPPEKLREWKTVREGVHGPALAALGTISEERLTELLVGAFTPPLERLQEITEQLERTGTLSATTVTELRQILDMLSSTADGVDARTAAGLAYAAEIFGTIHFSRMVRALEHAAEVLPAVARDLRRYGGDH